MEPTEAVDRLAALAHESRLSIFRELVRSGPEPVAAGALAEALGVPPPTLSFHLAHLSRAGLVTSRREGRSILYAPEHDAIGALVGYLYENCCGRGECLPEVVRLSSPKRETRSTR